MVHTNVGTEEMGALLHLLEVDISSKLRPSSVDVHAGNYAKKLDQQATAGEITDQQFRDGFEVISRIVSWSASELENSGHTIQLAELSPTDDQRHADIDAMALDFLSTFKDAQIETDGDVTTQVAYVQTRKDSSHYYVSINRFEMHDQTVEYHLSVLPITDETMLEVIYGFDPESRELRETLLEKDSTLFSPNQRSRSVIDRAARALGGTSLHHSGI